MLGCVEYTCAHNPCPHSRTAPPKSPFPPPGVARTLFMEQRHSYAPSLEVLLPCSVPGAHLLAAMQGPGEFALQTRGGTLHGLRLRQKREWDQGLGDALHSLAFNTSGHASGALITGGTRVRPFSQGYQKIASINRRLPTFPAL